MKFGGINILLHVTDIFLPNFPKFKKNEKDKQEKQIVSDFFEF